MQPARRERSVRHVAETQSPRAVLCLLSSSSLSSDVGIVILPPCTGQNYAEVDIQESRKKLRLTPCFKSLQLHPFDTYMKMRGFTFHLADLDPSHDATTRLISHHAPTGCYGLELGTSDLDLYPTRVSITAWLAKSGSLCAQQARCNVPCRSRLPAHLTLRRPPHVLSGLRWPWQNLMASFNSSRSKLIKSPGGAGVVCPCCS